MSFILRLLPGEGYDPPKPHAPNTTLGRPALQERPKPRCQRHRSQGWDRSRVDYIIYIIYYIYYILYILYIIYIIYYIYYILSVILASKMCTVAREWGHSVTVLQWKMSSEASVCYAAKLPSDAEWPHDTRTWSFGASFAFPLHRASPPLLQGIWQATPEELDRWGECGICLLHYGVICVFIALGWEFQVKAVDVRDQSRGYRSTGVSLPIILSSEPVCSSVWCATGVSKGFPNNILHVYSLRLSATLCLA